MPTNDQFDSVANSDLSRRKFIQASSAAALGAALVGPTIARATTRVEQAPAMNDAVVRLGIVGCGGRGTGAVNNAFEADANTKLVAMADTFADRLESSHNNLKKSEFGDRVDVPEDRRFVGFDGYKEVIKHCDVIILTTSPHFRPLHLEAAVAAGLHTFAEKPVATDAVGVRRAMAAYEAAKAKNLTMISGFCYRYHTPKVELMKRVHDGAIGDIATLQCTYNTGGLWHRGRQPEWTDMEWQIRNWLYFTWLSGDHITEQSIHSIDKILWAMQDVPPKKCTASGGRIVRTDPKYGNVFDHFNSVFEWQSGVKGFHSCRQWAGADSNVSDYAWGNQGMAAIQHHSIKGANPWRWKGDADSMYVSEWKALMASVRAGSARNNGDYMCKSTMMAIMARMAAYTGKTVTWEQMMNSQENLSPPSYEWGPLAVAPVPQPGKTPLV